MAEYDRRPRSGKGDKDSNVLFQSVGQALSAWELLDSSLAELFDVIVVWRPRKLSNSAGFMAYSAVSTSEARIEMLRACAIRALNKYPSVLSTALGFINTSQHFRARRNDIAHGHAINAVEYGYFLAPNNVSARGWEKDGSAKYQWCSSDIEYYTDHFVSLTVQCHSLVAEVAKLTELDDGGKKLN